MNLLVVLLCVAIILVLANYWTVWKIRRELNQIRESLQKNLAGN